LPIEKSHHLGDYDTSFAKYLRKGIDNESSQLETKSLSASSNPDGGYLINPQISKNIIAAIKNKSVMRQLAANETISSDSLDILEDMGKAGAGWVAETEARVDTSTPLFNKKKITVHELYAQPKATQKLIDDAHINIENWLVSKLTDIFSTIEDDSFINGDGKFKPRGILSYEAGSDHGKIEQINSGVSAGLTTDSLLKLYYSLHESYSGKASFLMHRSTSHQIRLLKDKLTDRYIWSPSLASDVPSTLLGVPLYFSSHMPEAKKDSIPIALADFNSCYRIVDRIGIRVLRDPFTDKPFVKFYTTKRVGGDVTNYNAIKLLKLSV
jgi:HK97 family phage major capsid protein